MHSLRRASIFWFSFVLVPSLLFGQGSGSTIPRSMGGPQGSFMVTNSIVVTLTRAYPNGKQFVVVHEKSEAPFTFDVEDTTKLKAHKEIKRRLGKKKISWADLQSGMRIRVTSVAATEEVLEVEVLKYEKKSLTGTLQAINNHDRSFTVVDEKSGKPWTFPIEDTAKLKADRRVKQKLAKKKISWADLQSGMRIQVTSIASKVLEIKILGYGKKS